MEKTSHHPGDYDEAERGVAAESGFGDTEKRVSKNHNDHLDSFLQRCEKRNVELNEEKIKFWCGGTLLWTFGYSRWFENRFSQDSSNC